MSAELDKFTEREVISIPSERGRLGWRQPGSATARETSSETPQKLRPHFIITTMLIKIARNRLGGSFWQWALNALVLRRHALCPLISASPDRTVFYDTHSHSMYFVLRVDDIVFICRSRVICFPSGMKGLYTCILTSTIFI